MLSFFLLSAGCAAGYRLPDDDTRSVRLALEAPAARSVSVAGSFNRWDPAGSPLSGPDRNGRWTITLHLSPGRYEYRYVIDGREWVLDPAAPLVEDGFGGRNSLLILSGDE